MLRKRAERPSPEEMVADHEARILALERANVGPRFAEMHGQDATTGGTPGNWANHQTNPFKPWSFDLDPADLNTNIAASIDGSNNLVLPAGLYAVWSRCSVVLPAPQTATREFWQLWSLTGSTGTSISSQAGQVYYAANGSGINSVLWLAPYFDLLEFVSGGTIEFIIEENTSTGTATINQNLGFYALQIEAYA